MQYLEKPSIIIVILAIIVALLPSLTDAYYKSNRGSNGQHRMNMYEYGYEKIVPNYARSDY
ncbi:hypothetical protein Ciccas_000310 [Cichlidogyrus casuarinus]|uniref:Uncharacterized protein n=1 Tax=Cichlidogyrus casuarinus TaxID=1844966 RepID=A0ABD2QN94_9PLAT